MLGYEGKRVIITGAASGMGEATARVIGDLGAEVYAFDIKAVSAPVKEALEVDMKDTASIDAAVDHVGGRVDALFNIAGLPGPPFSNLDTFLVNFAGARHLSERVISRMSAGGAIANVASVAGMGYLMNMENVMDLLATPDFDAARAWCEENEGVNNGYAFSKECLIVYSLMSAARLGERKIRINSIGPGITDTAMLPQFHANVGREWMDSAFLGPTGRYSTAEEQAWPLAFLNSDAASYISGINLFTDGGFTGGLMTGQIAPPAPPPAAK
ncbi:MAG: coniferyl-alcohol dehydrogenase [Myxococcota bacterium]